MDQLGGIDSAFVFLDSEAMPLHVGGMIIYDPSTAPGGALSYDQLRQHISDRVAGAPAMHRRLVRVPFDLDNPWWAQQDKIDFDHHVSRIALPQPADWRELCHHVGRFLARPVDLKRPPWELCFIEGLDNIDGLPAGAFAMLLKIHHSAIDGVSGMEMAAGLHDLDATSATPPPAGREVEAADAPSTVGLLARALPRLVTQPLRLAYLTSGQLPGLLLRSLRPRFGQPSEASEKIPHTRFGDVLGPHRSVGGVQLELKDIKTVRGAVPGLTVNDVLLAVVGGAIRHYLEKVDELPAEPLIGAVPVSLRSEEEKSGTGNVLTVITTTLGTDISDPLERARVIHEQVGRSKDAGQAAGGPDPVAITSAIPAGIFSAAGRMISDLQLQRRIPLVNTAVTNVPGPPVPIYLCGAKAVQIYGYALVAPGIGMVNMATSYRGTVYLGFQAGSTMMPDPQRYEDCLRLALDELLEAAGGTKGGRT
jgi:WS/DGAT/MGAT family acyltransferase